MREQPHSQRLSRTTGVASDSPWAQEQCWLRRAKAVLHLLLIPGCLWTSHTANTCMIASLRILYGSQVPPKRVMAAPHTKSLWRFNMALPATAEI